MPTHQKHLNSEWANKAKNPKRDKDFAGSRYEEFGFSDELCPTCGAHLYMGVCFNLCHLTEPAKKDFFDLRMLESARKVPPKEPNA